MKISCQKFLRFGIFFLLPVFFITLKISVSNVHANDLSFKTSIVRTVGYGPNSVAYGDFDESNDTVEYLAVANRYSDNVIILYINSSGSISKGRLYDVGIGPESIISKDFNGDHFLDLAVVNSGSHNITILFGNGDGTFGKIDSFAAGNSPGSIISEDFNGDGNLDLAVGAINSDNKDSDYIVIIPGNGDGTFDAARNINVRENPKSIDSSDFDKDNYQDILVSSSGSTRVSILFGNGDGTFRGPSIISIGKQSLKPVLANDFNGDGNPDLAVAAINSDNKYSDYIFVFNGNGDGTFDPAKNYDVGKSPESIIADYFNDDGYLDLAVANSDSDNVTILLNNGDGTFGVPKNYGVGKNPEFVIAFDFNQDSYLDLAVANSDSNSLTILLGKQDGTFDNYGAVDYILGGSPRAIIAHDFNNDNNDDLAVANNGSGNVTILIGDGKGSISEKLLYLVGEDIKSIVSANFDKDANSVLDLAVADSGDNRIKILFGNGDGTFEQDDETYEVGEDPDYIITDNFDKDGNMDLVVCNWTSDNFTIFFGTNDGTFNRNTFYATGDGPVSVISDDFNSDNYPDLAIANNDPSNIFVLLGKGDKYDDNYFNAAENYFTGDGPASIISNDFNNDQKTDLAVANSGSVDVSVLLGVGDGSFAESVNYKLWEKPEDDANVVLPIPTFVTAGDYNNDKHLDLAVSCLRTNNLYDNLAIFFGNGDGSFSDATTYSVGYLPRSAVNTDFNKDARVDLAIADVEGIYILLNYILNIEVTVGSPELETSEYGTKIAISIKLNTEPTANVIINLSSSDETEGVLSEDYLFFTPDNYSNPQTVVVTGVDDAEEDGNISYTINISKAVSQDQNYNGQDPKDLVITNIDNDPIPPPPNVKQNEDLGGGICFISSLSISLR